MILFQFFILEPKVETCCSICSPYNGLTILHHIEHRYEMTIYPTKLASLPHWLMHLTSRAGLTTNLITLLLCLVISTSAAEFNTVPAQLWLCAPLLILCLVQVWKRLKSTSISSSSAWSRCWLDNGHINIYINIDTNINFKVNINILVHPVIKIAAH